MSRFSRFPRRFPNRTRQHRAFDPSGMISQAKNPVKLEVVAITHRFADWPLVPVLQQNIVTKGYLIPTPIQDQTIPLILDGKDVVGIANTGTGKTAAFLIPLIQQASQNRQAQMLVITPTRELAVQIQAEFRDLAKNLSLFSALCIGGASLSRQVRDLKQRPNLIVGTPGRLKDLKERRVLRLENFKFIVLDEVDRMLDMGFIHDVQSLIVSLPKIRQSLFFSATIEGKTQEVMRVFLTNPVTVSVKTSPVTDQVNQETIRLMGRNKIDVLHDLLVKPGFDRVLVFGRTKWGMDKLAKALADRGFRVGAIHGNKSQPQRQRVLQQFKSGQVKILLATDVAQRGLDISDVSHVINFDLPETREDYIHRIGRTGRANKRGVAISLIP